MGVTDGNRERVGGVSRGNIDTGQQTTDHHLNLFFGGFTGTDDSLFHPIGRVLTYGQPQRSRRQKHHPSRHPELERRGGVLVDKGFLNGGFVRAIFGDHLHQPFLKLNQPLRQRQSGVRLDGSVGDGAEAVSHLINNPPPRDPKAGIKSDNAHDRIESHPAPSVKCRLPFDAAFALNLRDLCPELAQRSGSSGVVPAAALRYFQGMIQDLLAQLQNLTAGAFALAQNTWLLLAVGSLVFSFVVRFLLGPVRGQEMAGFALGPILCGMMVIVIGQTMFMEPAPGNLWTFEWMWRIDQLILLFAAGGWLFGLVLDVLRRPFALALVFSVFAAAAFCAAFAQLLTAQNATLPETFSKTVAFALISAFIIWRHAQSENGYSVLRLGQVGVASVGVLIVGVITGWSGVDATLAPLFMLVFVPGFAIAWLIWTNVGRGSTLGAVGLFGGLSPFLLFIGHQALVTEAMSLTAAALIVLILIGPDMVSGFERRRNLSDRVPFVSGFLYLALMFVLYIALVFTAGLDARS